jgi:putative toxin-antitoxin system antitoxin component (TIGR02293 family)
MTQEEATMSGHAVVTQEPIAEQPVSLLKETVEILGGPKYVVGRMRTELDVHDVIVKKFSGRVLTYVMKNALIMKGQDLSIATGIKIRTAQRIKAYSNRPLSLEQSGRLWKFAEVLAKATDVFGTREAAENWLTTPAIAFRQKRPIDLLESPKGAELVEQLLGRIDRNVYT